MASPIDKTEAGHNRVLVMTTFDLSPPERSIIDWQRFCATCYTKSDQFMADYRFKPRATYNEE